MARIFGRRGSQVALGILGPHQAAIDHLLNLGVILTDLVELPGAQQISARIPDFRDVSA